MKDFKDKIAVITGGANGIGYALAQEAIKRGMKVVIGDIDKEGLDRVEKEFKDKNANLSYDEIWQYWAFGSCKFPIARKRL